MALLARLASLALLGQARGVKLQGQLPSSKHFVEYVGKFCFDYDPAHGVAGLFEFTLDGQVQEGPLKDQGGSTEGPPCYGHCETAGSLYLFVYDDESQHWNEAQKEWHELTCEEMMHYSSFSLAINPLTGKMHKNVSVKEALRPRFWYFTFANCGAEILQAPTYEFSFLNPRMGIQEEFGVDQEGLVALHGGAFVLFLTLAVCLRVLVPLSSVDGALRSRPIFRLLLLSVGCSAVGAFCRTLHFLALLHNGFGLGFFDVMGQMWVCGAKALFALLLLLTAKGWALLYSRQELMQRRTVLSAVGLLLVFSASCEIHADYALDWNPSIYLYESWSGMTILLLNLFLFAEAARSMVDTYRQESSDEVRSFYATVSGASFVYFLTLPTLCVLSSLLHPWVRLKYVNRAEVWSRLLTSFVLAICLRPSRLDTMINVRLEEGIAREKEATLCRDPLCREPEDEDLEASASE